MRFEVKDKRETEFYFVIEIGNRNKEDRYILGWNAHYDTVVCVKKDAAFSRDAGEDPIEANRRWFDAIQIGEVWEMKGPRS